MIYITYLLQIKCTEVIGVGDENLYDLELERSRVLLENITLSSWNLQKFV